MERRSIDWIMVALVAMIVLSPAFVIMAADWTDGLEILWLFALGGMFAGLVISISRFRSLTAHLLSLTYGLAWIGYRMAAPLPHDSWRDKILDLVGRLSSFVALAVKGGTGRDSLIFVFMLALLFWWMGYVAIWNTVRYQRIWRALLPAGVTLLINMYYYVGSKLTPYLMIYLLCSLVIIVRSYTVLQESRWLSERIGYNSDVRFDLLRSGLILASAAVVVAWAAPTAATSETAHEMWRRVEGPWRSVEDDFNRMFSTLRSQVQAYGNPFGRTLTLRGPRNLQDIPVMQIKAPSDTRFYWRGMVYDRYTGAGWISTDSDSVQLGAWEEAKTTKFDGRDEITQTVTLYMPVDTQIFAAPEAARVSIPVKADARVSAGGVAELSQMISQKSLLKGADYQVVSDFSTADTDSLRGAGVVYPASIRDRYLQLPDSLPQTVRDQAQQIAGNLATPYDKASAIEAWLRTNVVYDDQTPAPPQDQDAVQYVLTIKRGYCDYYASAMVVMLRSLGVPARVAVGYAQGKYDKQSGTYNVSEKDSHSWAEVYFPKYGWVEFEPTAAQPTIDRPKPQTPEAGVTPEATSEAGAIEPRPTRSREGPEGSDVNLGSQNPVRRRLPTWIWGIVAVLGLGVAGFLSILTFERRGLGGLSPTAQLYARLLRFSAWLRVHLSDSQTPYERSAAFTEAVPHARDLIVQVADSYTREQYSPAPPDSPDSERLWRQLAPQLWLGGLRLRAQWFRDRAVDIRRWVIQFRRSLARFGGQFG